jgi:hypothetical protein
VLVAPNPVFVLAAPPNNPPDVPAPKPVPAVLVAGCVVFPIVITD